MGESFHLPATSNARINKLIHCFNYQFTNHLPNCGSTINCRHKSTWCSNDVRAPFILIPTPGIIRWTVVLPYSTDDTCSRFLSAMLLGLGFLNGAGLSVCVLNRTTTYLRCTGIS